MAKRIRAKRKTLRDIIAEKDAMIESLQSELSRVRRERDDARAEVSSQRSIVDAANSFLRDRGELLRDREILGSIRGRIVGMLNDEQKGLADIMKIDQAAYGIEYLAYLHQNRDIIHQVVHARERG